MKTFGGKQRKLSDQMPGFPAFPSRGKIKIK